MQVSTSLVLPWKIIRPTVNRSRNDKLDVDWHRLRPKQLKTGWVDNPRIVRWEEKRGADARKKIAVEADAPELATCHR